MPRTNAAQVSVRSDYLRRRVDEIAARTGKSVKTILEDAVRHLPEERPEIHKPVRMEKDGFLVLSLGSDRTVTLAEVQAGIDEDRERDLF